MRLRRHEVSSHIPYMPVEGMRTDEIEEAFIRMTNASESNPRKRALRDELAHRASVAAGLAGLDELRELDETRRPYVVRSYRA